MKVILSRSAEKDFRALPLSIQKKVFKQIRFLASSMQHPSLRVKKMAGLPSIWEARIDYHYRLTFQKEKNTLTIRKFGPHDEGLEKK